MELVLESHLLHMKISLGFANFMVKGTKAVGVNVSDGAFDDQDWNTLN